MHWYYTFYVNAGGKKGEAAFPDTLIKNSVKLTLIQVH